MKRKKTGLQKKLFLSAFFYKPLFVAVLLVVLPISLWAIQQTQQFITLGKNANGMIRPLGYSYGTINPLEKYPANDPPPENHPDINLRVRGWVPAEGKLHPVIYGGPSDPKAPQIWKILSHRPTIVSLYKIYSWDWTSNRKGPVMPLPDDPGKSFKPIQMVGFATSPGEEILVPDSGYRIGEDYQVMVLYADPTGITIKYGREDNIGIKFGYAIQIEGINVDPGLLSLYENSNNSGRNQLPALTGSQVMGTAIDREIRVAIRDTGDFLDPRSKFDWWQDVDYPIQTNRESTATPPPANPPITSTPAESNLPPKINPTPTVIYSHPTVAPVTAAQSEITPTLTVTTTATPIYATAAILTVTPASYARTPGALKIVSSIWVIILSGISNLSKQILP